MSGLNSENANQVKKALIEMGVQPDAGVGLPQDILMRDPDDPELKRLRSTAVGMLGQDKGEQYTKLVAQLGALQHGDQMLGATQMPPGGMPAPPAPEWARGLPDLRHLLKFDATQYVCPVAINGKLVLCIVDTGGHRTVLCTQMARELGL